MNKKTVAPITIILVVVSLSIMNLAFGHKKVDAPTQNNPQIQTASQSPTPPVFTGTDDILKNALNLYLAKKREGVDLANGPCLGKIAEDWVLDIAHNPRQPVDNDPQNQCQDFTEGKAHHFIELDPDGKLIKSS